MSENILSTIKANAVSNANVVRWYILTLPVGHRGSVKGLKAENIKREKTGLSPLEIFAPTYVEVERKNGEWVRVVRPMFFNYVFLCASEKEIYGMMRSTLGLLSFLPRVRDKSGDYYPYISQKEMDNLQWISRSYPDIIPIYYPQSNKPMRGDRIRIIEGRFKGAEAIVVIQPGQGKTDVMVRVENWASIPLIDVQEGQYEVIGLSCEKTRIYKRFDNTLLAGKLHQALERFYAKSLTECDIELAEQTVKEYGNAGVRTDARLHTGENCLCKLYALILPAYTILGDKKSCESAIVEMSRMLQDTKAPQVCALLYVTLYGSTDNYRYYQRSHELIDPWRKEENLCKNKRIILQRLNDYDAWLSHG